MCPAVLHRHEPVCVGVRGHVLILFVVVAKYIFEYILLFFAFDDLNESIVKFVLLQKDLCVCRR